VNVTVGPDGHVRSATVTLNKELHFTAEDAEKIAAAQVRWEHGKSIFSFTFRWQGRLRSWLKDELTAAS
jgi:hypothetical protein